VTTWRPAAEIQNPQLPPKHSSSKGNSKSKLENAWIERTCDCTEVSCSVIRRNRSVAGVVRDVESFRSELQICFLYRKCLIQRSVAGEFGRTADASIRSCAIKPIRRLRIVRGVEPFRDLADFVFMSQGVRSGLVASPLTEVDIPGVRAKPLSKIVRPAASISPACPCPVPICSAGCLALQPPREN
jgi:hypothetical protein